MDGLGVRRIDGDALAEQPWSASDRTVPDAPDEVGNRAFAPANSGMASTAARNAVSFAW